MVTRLELTEAEARALLALAEEGAVGLLTDPESARAYIGPSSSQRAAERALAKLRSSIYRPPRSAPPPGVELH